MKAHGPRVYSEETEGLLSKTVGQRGMFCSGLLDLDRLAQNRLDLDLISFAGNRSDGQDQAGARGGGVPPELAQLGLPRADSRGVWVGKGLRDTRSPPGACADPPPS